MNLTDRLTTEKDLVWTTVIQTVIVLLCTLALVVLRKYLVVIHSLFRFPLGLFAK